MKKYYLADTEAFDIRSYSFTPNEQMHRAIPAEVNNRDCLGAFSSLASFDSLMEYASIDSGAFISFVASSK